VKKGKNKMDLAEQLREISGQFKKKSGPSGEHIWCGSTKSSSSPASS